MTLKLKPCVLEEAQPCTVPPSAADEQDQDAVSAAAAPAFAEGAASLFLGLKLGLTDTVRADAVLDEDINLPGAETAQSPALPPPGRKPARGVQSAAGARLSASPPGHATAAPLLYGAFGAEPEAVYTTRDADGTVVQHLRYVMPTGLSVRDEMRFVAEVAEAAQTV